MDEGERWPEEGGHGGTRRYTEEEGTMVRKRSVHVGAK